MLFVERNQNGSYTVSALVRNANTPFAWYEHQTYYGYQKREIRGLFRQHLKNKKMTLCKD